VNDVQPRLLIIDDDESYRAVLARSLSRKGFMVEAAYDPASGLIACENFDPEYIVLDLNLSGLSGLNLIQPMLQISPNARILVLTGYASIQTTVTAMKLGACHYLPKPASVADIVTALLKDELDAVEDFQDKALTVRHLEWEYIQRKLAEHGGNITATACTLKMHRRTLQRKLTKRRPSEAIGEID
jgi:two-component system response regulator RegA